MGDPGGASSARGSDLPAVTVRPCRAEDAGRLALVGQATFLETFAGILHGDAIVAHCAVQHAPTLYEAWLADPDKRLWLAEAAARDATEPSSDLGAPIGYALLDRARPPFPHALPGDDELKRIYALARFHGSGIGARLLAEAVAAAVARGSRRLLLGVYARNARAIAFYRKHGFEEIGERQFEVGPHRYDDRVLARML